MRRLFAAVSLFAFAACANATEPQKPGYEGVPVDLKGVVKNHVEVAENSNRGGVLQAPFSVKFLPADWPNLTMKTDSSWDWSRYGRLLVDVENPGPKAVVLGIRVDDDTEADGTLNCRSAETMIAARSSASIAVELGAQAMSLGMRGLPGQAGVRSLPTSGEGPFNLGHIVAYQFYLHQPKTPQTLILSHVRLAPRDTFAGIVDRYGQYARADWPGRLHEEDEFAQRRANELADLKAHPTLPDRDRFGGWSQGPRREASGYFRAEKVEGKWWLVDPDGRLFFSSGMNEVRADFPTYLTERESMFTGLPGKSDPLARFFGTTQFVHSGPVKDGRTFDFYGANLARKYGQTYLADWKETTLKRLPSWGFNTFGNWSDRFHRNGRVPYVASAGVRGDHARVSSGSDYWGKMHDPFDPRFARNVARSLGELADEMRGDPWCLGYFVDNELSWGDAETPGDAGRYGLGLGTLESDADQPAKIALIAQLRRKYTAIGRLNAAWKSSFLDWKGLEASWEPPLPLADELRADLSEFIKDFARHYFKTVRDQLRKSDPRHLYLGCRFAKQTPETVQAAAEICDVVSFNLYAPRVDAKEWSFLNDLDRPCLIGEFHVGALDRGMFHPGLIAAPDQAARASTFEDYVGSVLDHPALVGCHWFQYVDEPLTGRTFDGENYAIGFVSVTDTPYPELVAAARSVHRSAYSRRFGLKPGTPR